MPWRSSFPRPERVKSDRHLVLQDAGRRLIRSPPQLQSVSANAQVFGAPGYEISRALGALSVRVTMRRSTI
jgi:hypothetical protein